jgi:hypothetical protein
VESALVTNGESPGGDVAEEERRGVCAVVCGAFAAGACLHLLAAVAAAALAIGMLVIAFTNDSARWVGLSLLVVVTGLATIAVCAWRQRP